MKVGWKVRKAKEERGLNLLEIHLLKLKQWYNLHSITTLKRECCKTLRKGNQSNGFPLSFTESTTNIKY